MTGYKLVNPNLCELAEYGLDSEDPLIRELGFIVSRLAILGMKRAEVVSDFEEAFTADRQHIDDLEYLLSRAEEREEELYADMNELSNQVAALRLDLDQDEHRHVIAFNKARLYESKAHIKRQFETIQDHESTIAVLRLEIKELNSKLDMWNILSS